MSQLSIVLCVLGLFFGTNSGKKPLNYLFGLYTNDRITRTAAPELKDAPKIIGGDGAQIQDYPYQISMRWMTRGLSKPMHFCGGSLVSRQHVVTAAHCVERKNSPQAIANMRIYTGTSRSDSSTGQSHMVRSVAVHPGYRGAANTYLNDIAVVTLAEPVELSEMQAPIKLPSRDVQNSARAVITGWGYNQYSSQVTPIQLQKASMRLISSYYCEKSMPFAISSTQVCAFNGHSVGVCSGDSGGPLVSNGELVGVASYVIQCARGHPDVYTNVYPYVGFIKAIKEKKNFPEKKTAANVLARMKTLALTGGPTVALNFETCSQVSCQLHHHQYNGENHEAGLVHHRVLRHQRMVLPHGERRTTEIKSVKGSIVDGGKSRINVDLSQLSERHTNIHFCSLIYESVAACLCNTGCNIATSLYLLMKFFVKIYHARNCCSCSASSSVEADYGARQPRHGVGPAVDQQPSLRSGHKCRRALPCEAGNCRDVSQRHGEGQVIWRQATDVQTMFRNARFLHLIFPDLWCARRLSSCFLLLVGGSAHERRQLLERSTSSSEALLQVQSIFTIRQQRENHTNTSTFKEGLTKLQRMVLIGGPDNGIITPWQSSQFGYYNVNETVGEMRDRRDEYQNDLIGLKTLDKNKS
ncbi:unnamed protein product [Trichogramma brassicae]|uniref:Peptidase S1 domain-containing protein n=1 Tax=Trichogramma brassicae TaxID=86971 RepID=A0A6H5J1I9_9HYME|nr:unnamed protein product [Trichogramma brassicae]